MQRLRPLFVDDEAGIRQTMPQILEQHGFVVKTSSTVNEALAEITSDHFDVLISDLNIGEAGDGFVVVSAMRRTQPNCVTIILTGYPGFESALQAIRRQVDDYLIKPASVPSLIKMIKDRLEDRTPKKVQASKRVPHVLREQAFEITQRALAALKSDPRLGTLPISDEERIEHIPHILAELATMLESEEPDRTQPESLRAAVLRGTKRCLHGYTIPLLVTHVRLVERAIYDVIHENLMSLNLSYLMLDLKRLNDSLGCNWSTHYGAFSPAQKIEVWTGGTPDMRFRQHCRTRLKQDWLRAVQLWRGTPIAARDLKREINDSNYGKEQKTYSRRCSRHS